MNGEDNMPTYQEDILTLNEKKHSKLGIASFITAVMTVVIMVYKVMSVTVRFLEVDIPDAQIIGIVLTLFLCLAINVVGTIMGLISLFMHNRKKTFGAIGFVANLVILVGCIIFIAIS